MTKARQRTFIRHLSPHREVNLFIAVLREAWCDAFLPCTNRLEALAFMEGHVIDWNRSYLIICETIGVDANRLRHGYYKFKKYYAVDNKTIHPEDAFNWLINTLIN